MPIEFNTVIHRFSAVPGVIPSESELYPGELALNIADGTLFTAGVYGNVINLSELNSKFSFAGSLQGFILTYDAALAQYVATDPKDFLDGGTY
jgi:hypothetical protein